MGLSEFIKGALPSFRFSDRGRGGVVGRWVARFWRWFDNRRWARLLLHFVTYAAAYVAVVLHFAPSGSLLPPLQPMLLGAVVAYVPVFLVVWTPLYLVAEGVRSVQEKAASICAELQEAKLYADDARQGTDHWESLDLRGGVSSAIAALRSATGTAYILSHDLIYFCADLVREDLDLGDPERSEVREAIGVLAEHSMRFMAAGSDCRAELNIIVADFRNKRVSDWLRDRARKLRLRDDESFDKVVEHMEQRLDDLRRLRGQKGLVTNVHYSPVGPRRRLLVTDQSCFVQEIPPESAGITEAILHTTANDAPVRHTALRCLLRSLTQVL